MITDLVQIQRLGEKKLKENELFRRHMKAHYFPERQFRHVAEEIEDKIDCRACANCCKLAGFLRITPKQFIAEYTTMSVQEEEEEELILRRTDAGCIFLDGNDCSIYEARPDTCSNFPHLIRGAGSIQSRMWQMIDRATYCPIVYNSLEKYKEIVGFKAPKS